ncbi:MAG: diaminopimelate decarboxylase [Ruminococcus sp.]|nr:diaminopimelate decarboxylase [Ruminococcus sp.]
MDIKSLALLTKDLHVPAYVFNIDEFDARAEMVKKYFGEKTGLCFSIKANPFLLAEIPAIFDKIEVCSPGELTVCEKTHVDMSRVIFSGVNKGKADVERAMDDGVGTFTAESWLHARLIDEAAKARGKRVPLLLRLTAGSQFGMNEDDIIAIIRDRDCFEGIEIVGIHYFSGTQKKKAKTIDKELTYIDEFCTRVKDELDFTVDRIEYGTGLAVDYFNADADAAEEQRLSEISEKIREIAEKYSLTVEMGRFFAAPCGYYMTGVVDVKTNKGVNYAILDGGLHQVKYFGQYQGMQLPQILHIGADESVEKEKWTLCGSLCTTADVLAGNAEFADLSIGDVLIFCRVGAYSVMEGMSVFLSRDLPQVALYSEKNGLRIVREPFDTDVLNTPL